MQNWFWNLLETLSQHPEFGNLKVFVERLMQKRGNEVSFIVVFGSVAKGTWTFWSDIDIFVGLNRDDGLRLIDRIGQFTEFVQGKLEVFSYARSEWQRMFETFNPLLLEALADGIVLIDSGEFASMKEIFCQWQADGLILRTNCGWRISADLPVNSDGLSTNWVSSNSR